MQAGKVCSWLIHEKDDDDGSSSSSSSSSSYESYEVPIVSLLRVDDKREGPGDCETENTKDGG